FETYVVTMIAAMLLGQMAFPGGDIRGVLLPLGLGASAIVSSIIGQYFVRLGNRGNIMGALYKGLFATTIVAIGLFWYINHKITGVSAFFWDGVIGLLVMIAITFITEYYTSTAFRPVKKIAEASQTGPATNIISGLAVGLESTFLPILVVVGGIAGSFFLTSPQAVPGIAPLLMGAYGIAIAAVGMLSAAGMVVAIDSYGPITDNAGGIAEMSELPHEVRNITDALDAVGNTTKAVTKGYAIGSAGLGALALFITFTQRVAQEGAIHTNLAGITYTLQDPYVIMGLFIGGMIPFFASSLFMNAVGKAAQAVIVEVRRQFREIPGIMERKAKPDYGRCVDLVTRSAIREMIFPGAIAVAAPVIVCFISIRMLGGMLAGAILGGMLMAFTMATGGGAWDNGKKLIETGEYGGKGSEAHKAAVVGDTVGDPFKDTAGPALNPMIKILNIVALLVVTAFAASLRP
ncbi:MAG: sodium-translocating pyrophosphatase, partial [Cyanobacteria bacterium REEB65]|nr:sodium-translocating pyrophosphatase [Cyanobacteria bacterium REEB65]